MLTLKNYYYVLMSEKQTKRTIKKRKVFELATLGFEKDKISEKTFLKYKKLFNKARDYNTTAWSFGENENEYNVNSPRRKRFYEILDRIYEEIKQEAKKLNLTLETHSFGSFSFRTPNGRNISTFYDGE